MTTALTAQNIFDLFFHRKDVFALQLPKGQYIPVKRPIHLGDIEKHISGEQTIGAYCLDTDNTIKWACMDIDLHEDCPKCKQKGDTQEIGSWFCKHCNIHWNGPAVSSLRFLANHIYNTFSDTPRMLEFSGRRGYHVWLFFEPKINAGLGQRFILSRLHSKGIRIDFEIFPKQTELNEFRLYGNLVKVILGKHQKSGKFSEVICMDKIDSVLRH